MMRALTLLFAASVLTLAAPLAAQSVSERETGSRIARPAPARNADRVLNEEQRGRDMMNQLARCAIDMQPKAIAAAIVLEPGPDRDVLAKAATGECLEYGEMRFSGQIMRGAVFSELYRRAEASGGALLPKFRVSPPDLSKVPSTENPAAATNWFLLWVSDCLAKTNRSDMHTILKSRTATSAQRAAYAAIIPAIGPCVPEGQTMTFSRVMLEGGFGEYLYRTLPAPAAGAED